MIAGIGYQAPIVIALAFVPTYLIALAFKYMNQADPDCGTTFTWSGRAFGPIPGWIGGWAVIYADVLVMASLSQIAGSYTFLLFGADKAAASTFWVGVAGVIWILLMSWICYVGIELSARTQYFLLAAEILALAIFAVVALVKVYTGDAFGSVHPSLSWLNPFEISSFGALASGLLLAIFIYWGWDTAVSVNEETEDSTRTPGRAAVVSTVLLLGDLPRRLDRRAGVPRHRVPEQKPGRRAQRPRQGRPRLAARQGADHRRPDLRVGVDPDDDPARNPAGAVDGGARRLPEVLRPDQPEVPHPGCRRRSGCASSRSPAS